MAPPGGESFYVLSPVPHLGNAAIDWESVAPGYGDAILAALEPHLPGLRDAIVTRRHCTPAAPQKTSLPCQNSSLLFSSSSSLDAALK